MIADAEKTWINYHKLHIEQVNIQNQAEKNWSVANAKIRCVAYYCWYEWIEECLGEQTSHLQRWGCM